MSQLDLSQLPGCPVPPEWRPVTVSKALVQWCRFHFSNADLIKRDCLKGYIWIDSNATPINIGTLAEYKPASDGTRPSVLVERADQQLQSAASTIGLRTLGGTQHIGSVPTVYPVQGNHVVFCIGGREREADELAAEVLEESIAYCSIVAERLHLRRFRPVGVGARQQLKDHKETWAVPVYFSYDYDITTLATPSHTASLRDTYLNIANLALQT